MDVKPFSEADAARWDRFILQQAHGTFFQSTGWKRVIERTFGYTPIYYYAESGGEIVGILPLFHIRNLLVRSALISVPFGVYGGLLADNPDARQALLEKAKALAEQWRAEYVEFKSVYKTIDDLPTKDLYVTFVQELQADPEANLEWIPRKTRRMVRVSLKNNLDVEFTREGLNDFYDIYATSLHQLGTPAFPLPLFRHLLETFPKECFFLFVRHGGRRIAGVMTFAYKDCLLPYYGGAYRAFNHLAVNNFMYWKLIEYGGLNGFRWFDFGRSKKNVGSGSYDFKRHWGMQEINLEYQYYLRPGARLPDLNPANPKYKFFVEGWKKLPFPLTKILGPRLVRFFP